MLNRNVLLVALVLLAATILPAQTIIRDEPDKPPVPQMIVNARWVYVTGLRGDEFSDRTLMRDREAIADVRSAFQDWKKYKLTMRPEDADLLIVVRRGSVDMMDAYHGRLGQQGTPMWSGAESGGLEPPELPLFQQFKKDIEAAAAKSNKK